MQGVLSSWMRHTPFAFVLETEGGRLQGYDHVRAMRKLQELAPHAKWYVLSDEDTVFFLFNMLCTLGGMDSNEPHFVGSHHCQGS